MTDPGKKLKIGWRETVSLPDLGINRFAAKFDTGALTTALHATNVVRFQRDGRPWVRFTPDHDALQAAEDCALPLLHTRSITNTSGVPEERFIVATTLRIADRAGRIEVSLTDRSDMKFPIIIGRSAMRLLRVTIDPSRSWLVSQKSKKPKGQVIR